MIGYCLVLHAFGFSGITGVFEGCPIKMAILLFLNQVLAAIPFIAEFKLACDGGEVRKIFLSPWKRLKVGKKRKIMTPKA